MPNPNNEEVKNPIIIHYNLFLKPWQYDEVQYKDYFWKFAKKVPYYEELINIKNNYSEENKQEDEKFMNQMVERAKMLTSSEVSMKKVFENGLEKRL